ncbi:MAG: adenylate/guanylate cyclase domain-containing protein [Streptosporangiaceae bacterium]
MGIWMSDITVDLPEAGRLEELLLGGTALYRQSEIAALTGVPEITCLRIWQALGFPTPPPDMVAFTRQDAAALQDIRELLDFDQIDEELVVHLSRAVGQTMGRLASWLGDVWIKRIFDGSVDLDSLADLLPRFERLLLQGWRRHLAASGMRALASVGDTPSTAAELTVGFADIVSFTELSRNMDGDVLAAFVERFEVVATEICTEFGGRIVKTLGDEVLFSADSPVAAAEIALRITERSGLDDSFPRIRAGLAYGPVVQSLGDVFGTPVNLAARLTAQANPGSVLIDARLEAELADRFETAVLKPRTLQGLGKVRPWSLRRRALSD